MLHELKLPLKDEDVRTMQAGDQVLLSGTLLTARDAAHKWLVETLIEASQPTTPQDQAARDAITPILDHGAIYHCGPLIAGQISQSASTNAVQFISAGPTTSIRQEPYAHKVMAHFHVSAVIGKGGMGAATLRACQQTPAVYLSVVGGAGALIAGSIQRVISVHKLEFGIPEAIWIIQVKDFPAVVTMDSHGQSLHDQVSLHSRDALERLLKQK
jgi:fumarate hydratase class I